MSIAKRKTAKEAWDSLKVMCVGADRVQKAKVQTLKTEFENLNMKETDHIDDFCMKLYGVVTNIRVLGEKMEESNVVKKLLRAVPSRYLQIASTIEQFGDLEEMTVEEVMGRLKAHDERLRGQADSSGGQLLLTQEEWQKRSYKGGYDKHRSGGGNRGKGKSFIRSHSTDKGKQGQAEDASRGAGSGRDRSKLKCYNCGIYGHYASECRKPRKEKEKNQEANLTKFVDDEPALLLAEKKEIDYELVLLNEGGVVPKLSADGENKVHSNLWYLDNGASNHMTGDRSKFKVLDESIVGQVRFGDGSSVSIKGKGSKRKREKPGGKSDKICR